MKSIINGETRAPMYMVDDAITIEFKDGAIHVGDPDLFFPGPDRDNEWPC